MADSEHRTHGVDEYRESTEHELVRVTERVPGNEPSEYENAFSDDPSSTYETSYWRCRYCGQERNHRDEFDDSCAVGELPDPVTDGGYSVEDPRTRRALTEGLDVRFYHLGSEYEVHSESGSTYVVDIDAWACTCPDHQSRAVACKHIRRVDLELRAGTVPGPDGTFDR